MLLAAVTWVATHAWRLLAAYTCDVETGEWQHRLDSPQRRRRWLSSMPMSLAPTADSYDNGGDGLRAVGQDEAQAQAREGAHVHAEAEAGADAVQMPVSAKDLVDAARDIVIRSYAGPVPLRSVRSPLLDAQWADLLWFALPADTLATLRGQQQRLSDDRVKFKSEMVMDEALTPVLSDPHLVLSPLPDGRAPASRPAASIFHVGSLDAQLRACASGRAQGPEARQASCAAGYGTCQQQSSMLQSADARADASPGEQRLDDLSRRDDGGAGSAGGGSRPLPEGQGTYRHPDETGQAHLAPHLETGPNAASDQCSIRHLAPHLEPAACAESSRRLARGRAAGAT